MWETMGAFYREQFKTSKMRATVALQNVKNADQSLKRLVDTEDYEGLTESSLANRTRGRVKASIHSEEMQDFAEKAKRFNRFAWPSEVDDPEVSPRIEWSANHGFVVIHVFCVDTVSGEHAGTCEIKIPYTDIRWEEDPCMSMGRNCSSFRWVERSIKKLILGPEVRKDLANKCNPMAAFSPKQVSIMELYEVLEGLVGHYVSIQGHQNIFGGAGVTEDKKSLVLMTGTSAPNFYPFVLEDPVYVVNSSLIRPVQEAYGGGWNLEELMYLHRGRSAGNFQRRTQWWHRNTKEKCESAICADLPINTWGGV